MELGHSATAILLAYKSTSRYRLDRRRQTHAIPMSDSLAQYKSETLDAMSCRALVREKSYNAHQRRSQILGCANRKHRLPHVARSVVRLRPEPDEPLRWPSHDLPVRATCARSRGFWYGMSKTANYRRNSTYESAESAKPAQSALFATKMRQTLSSGPMG
jgi:hypothetical protein